MPDTPLKPKTKLMDPKNHVTDERLDKVRRVLARRQPDLCLVMANIHDPHNVSAILRSCDAFGVARVHLYYTHTAFPQMGKKSSASARKWVERVRHTDAAAMVEGLRKTGHQVLCTGFSATAKPLHECDFTRPTAVIMGNEHAGADPELLALAPEEVYIPMQGMVQSLNVSVAAAVILYEAFSQRRRAGLYDEARYAPEDLERLVDLWCAK